MESQRPFSSSSFRSSSAVFESEKKSSMIDEQNSFSSRMGVHSTVPDIVRSEEFIGVVEVHIHQARDIHNICIYHKQDVYAKFCLTSDPEVTVQTKTINGGGKNPVFDETLRLDVRTIDSSLKCEVWMLSRVKNYLEDQLLGFTLVPMADVLVGAGKQLQEFSLSSTDLFHSPAGFVQMSISYAGSSPDVLAIAPPSSASPDAALLVSEAADTNSLPAELDKIEFPDLNMVNENQLMVSEYFGIPCTDQSSEAAVTTESDDNGSTGISAHVGESLSTESADSAEISKSDTPLSSISTTDSSSQHAVPASSLSASDPSGASSKSPTHGSISSEKEKYTDKEGEADSSSEVPKSASSKPFLNVNTEPKKTVVQQDIVDLYMKSMQQFTESLAKMKLPMDVKNSSPKEDNVNPSSDQKLQPSKGNGSRVFYGSRAFF